MHKFHVKILFFIISKNLLCILNFFSYIIFLNESWKYAQCELFFILVRAIFFFFSSLYFWKHFLFLSFFFLTGNYESPQHKPLIFSVTIFLFFSFLNFVRTFIEVTYWYSIRLDKMLIDLFCFRIELAYNGSREDLEPYVPSEHRPVASNTS